MQLVTISGPPSSGKTAVISKVIAHLQQQQKRVGVVKFDCLVSDDQSRYETLGVPVRTGIAGNLCPDHYFVSNIQDCVEWGQAQDLQLLLSESAGLCNRCSPHVRGVMAVCVIDNLMGLTTPKKVGPMLRFADVVVITKGDIVSQAEREVFAYQVRQSNPRAKIIHVNGLSGQGCFELSTLFNESPSVCSLVDGGLRFTLPAAVCSYCLGETQIGDQYQVGNVKKMAMGG
ncbi:GTP-binding protein [Vibrio sp. WXL210]|uniref:GTP-binding protein n=1 Tax=Vibrio sp. WXL210 TaxID=3450709 RepID=UPI003EC928E1